jgi:nickel-dependent lactate racemase
MKPGAAESIAWETFRPQPLRDPRPTADVLSAALIAAGEPLTHFLDPPGEPIQLLVNDPYRSTRTRAALEGLAEWMRATGAAARFRALVATGTHRVDAADREAFERATFGGVGLWIEEVLWHDAEDAVALVPLASVRLHRRLAESRRLLAIGSVEPHYFAGATGAHKTLTIGCMSRADIERNHAGALHPASDVLALHGNPVYDGVVAVLESLSRAGKRLLAVNEVVCEGSVVAAAVGDPLSTLGSLLPVVRTVYQRLVRETVDVLHLRVPPPLGRNLYQADKALKNNHAAVRDGGGIILEAACEEGIGPDAFLSLLRRSPDYATARGCVEHEGYRLGDHKAVKLRYLTDPAQRGVRVALVARNVSPHDAELLHMRACPDVEAALAWLRSLIVGRFEQGIRVEDAGNLSVQVAARDVRTRRPP